MGIIEAKNLSFSYPNEVKKAIDNISFSIDSGEFIVICGESGCGKTTLLRLLKRELAPLGEKKGEIYFNGINLEKIEDRKSACDIGYVLQNPEHQIVTDKVWHELVFGLENIGLKTPVIRRRVGEMANFFGIQEWFHKNTAELSGGQKQLLNLASVMVMQPKILILDEPTSQLDPIAASDFINTIQKLNKELGVTIIMAEHRLEDIFSYADRVAVMEKGRIIAFEKTKKIGMKLKEIDKEHPMLLGLPSAMRIFNEVPIIEESPITVRDGRNFLSAYFDNKIEKLERENETIDEDNEVIVELKDAWFRYEREMPDILEGVSAKIAKGKITSILGGNGSGKTTLLSVISGQNKPYKGKIFINGKKISSYKGSELYKHNIALLPQNPQDVFLKSTVEDDYKEIGHVMKYTKEDIKKYTDEIVDMLDIRHILKKHPYDLSGGEQQKAAMGKILLLKPKIMLLDEPTKGLDSYSKDTLKKILLKLKVKGITIIMVTHDVEFAAESSDYCCLYFDHQIASMDKPVEFFSNNNFYTTAANRISRHMYTGAILCEDVIKLCKINGVKK